MIGGGTWGYVGRQEGKGSRLSPFYGCPCFHCEDEKTELQRGHRFFSQLAASPGTILASASEFFLGVVNVSQAEAGHAVFSLLDLNAGQDCWYSLSSFLDEQPSCFSP